MKWRLEFNNNYKGNCVIGEMIVGITGTLGAGKGTIAEYLKKEGFKHYSVREFLTEELGKMGLEANRENLVLIANRLREQNSPSYIVEKLYDRANLEGTNCVIESLRAPGEIAALRKKGKFILFAIDADVKLRYSRIIVRRSVTDNISFDEFVKNEKEEMISNNPNEQNISKCMELADFIFNNNSTIDNLHKEVGHKLKEISREKTINHQRPNWDEYFMGIVEQVGSRGTCDRGRSGCLIARNKQILVTGYVGSPLGIPHCDDVGHQMKKTIHEDHTESWHCVRTAHAEQNAICQAAKLGISVDGGTLYCKMTPCSACAKMIINAGIKKIICEKGYHRGKESEELFERAGIEFFVINQEIEDYPNQ
tara:strand:- start:407 stop:1504 length:1098 start_codon:yes stop_codon:yes gene_type:complete